MIEERSPGNTDPMHVTIVDADVPFPANSGKRLRSLNLVLPLAARHHITYIARTTDPAEGRLAAAFLADHNIEPVLVAEPLPARSGPAFFLSLARNLVSPLPYSVASHISPGMRRAVETSVRSRRVDLIQLEHVSYMYCAEGLEPPVIVQAHNVESLIWKRLVETTSNPLKKAYLGLQGDRYATFERRAYQAVQGVVAVSEADARLARELYGAPRMSVVDNGVDVAYFRDVPRQEASKDVLFVGALDWRPNIDAVEQLLDRILPDLRARVPDARLVVVGRKPSDRMRRAVAATEGATLHADVPDIRPFMGASAVMAVPLRIGGGSRLKILESLAAGLPVVSTSIGAEGLELEHGRDLIIADQHSQFVGALADAIQTPLPARAQAEHGRRTIAARYDWRMLAARLEQVWEQAAGKHPTRQA